MGDFTTGPRQATASHSQPSGTAANSPTSAYRLNTDGRGPRANPEGPCPRRGPRGSLSGTDGTDPTTLYDDLQCSPGPMASG